MKRRMTVKNMLKELGKQSINTWFDLGLFVDKFKEEKPLPTAEFKGTFDDYKKDLKKGGLGFVSFYYSVDGVTIEVDKYAKAFEKIIPKVPIHFIAGKFYPESAEILNKNYQKHQIDEMKGFDDWAFYQDFYITKLERGSTEYNALIIKFWQQTLQIAENLGSYVEKNNIQLLYLINVCSNPGNVASSLAIMLVSEYLGIPVINNCHDYYWEGGSKQVDIEFNNKPLGPRDFFFKNADVGEFFSQIEVLFPWESRSWLTVNINDGQTQHVIRENGHNPANVTEIGTALDTKEYQNATKRQKINSFIQVEKILSNYNETLTSSSVSDCLNNIDPKQDPKPILIGESTRSVKNFLSENIIFLQPTRIVSRKRIETGFELIKKMFKEQDFINKFKESTRIKLTILVTGPIPMGQHSYFKSVVRDFGKLLKAIPEEYRERVYLGFLLSELDKEFFKSSVQDPIGIPELYNIASLILLPSKTEGRGLPIIEATASGIPIFCRRYEPETVYSAVIGEHLPEKDRLKVIEYNGREITPCNVKDVIDRVFFPHQFLKEFEHNLQVVDKRFSLDSLQNNIEDICYKLYLQLTPNTSMLRTAKLALIRYKEINSFSNDDLKAILNTKNRQYLPGYGRLEFLLNLKSLIDPSYFRVEAQRTRGAILDFARRLVENTPNDNEVSYEQSTKFFNIIDNIFRVSDGQANLRHDHSFSYRHRNKISYPYQKYTFEEITGLVSLLYNDIIKPKHTKTVSQNAHFFTDLSLCLSQMTSSNNLAIDDRRILINSMKSNLPAAYFPGKYVKYEIELFVLQSIRSRLGLKIQQELSEEMIKKNVRNLAPIYIFAHDVYLNKYLSADEIINYIENGPDNELRMLYNYKIVRVVKTYQLCVGIHFPQLGENALRILREVKDNNGFIISNRRNAAMMTDIVDIDRFHIGKVSNSLTSNIMGIPMGSGYIQFVPAGVRTTLAFPTPIQTSKDFSRVLKSPLYKELCESIGEKKVLKAIKEDAETKGSPIKVVLENLTNKKKKAEDVESSFITGVYNDGMPWNGAMAKANIAGSKKPWEFVAVSSVNSTKRVTKFVSDFKRSQNVEPKIAWNGGYILNGELVGKLGLPESYIGSPLGLIISNKKLQSAPLFNKPALLIYEDGSIDIKRVNSSKGLIVSDDKAMVNFGKNGYNTIYNKEDVCYYDLMLEDNEIEGNGRVIVRLAGNIIKEVIFTKPNEKVKIIPVGLTLSFPKDKFPESFNQVDKKLVLKINGIKNVLHAVEAGPMLIRGGKYFLSMADEGWKTQNSIATQAARLDFTDMRGPKIAVGLDSDGNLIVITINGRIRESVGATHLDMADILMKFGIVKAMGFDPGGSSTLVVNGETLNISPYNSDYEKNIYALPPEPRAVANAVIGFIK